MGNGIQEILRYVKPLGSLMPRKKKDRGRPVKYPMPPKIDADPETIAEVVLRAKPKKVWRYEQKAGRSRLS